MTNYVKTVGNKRKNFNCPTSFPALPRHFCHLGKSVGFNSCPEGEYYRRFSYFWTQLDDRLNFQFSWWDQRSDVNLFLSGSLDPYVRVAFGSVSQTTQPLEKTLCPTWDQTLIFEKLVIHGAVEKVVENPPNIIMEIYDKDQVVSIRSKLSTRLQIGRWITFRVSRLGFDNSCKFVQKDTNSLDVQFGLQQWRVVVICETKVRTFRDATII